MQFSLGFNQESFFICYSYRWVIPLTYVTQQNPSERHVQLLERQADDGKAIQVYD